MMALVFPLLLTPSPTTTLPQAAVPAVSTQRESYQNYFSTLLTGEGIKASPEKRFPADPLACRISAATLWNEAFPSWPAAAFPDGEKNVCSLVTALATFFPLSPRTNATQEDAEMTDDKPASSFISILNLTMPSTSALPPTWKPLTTPRVVSGVTDLPEGAFIFPLPHGLVVTSPHGIRYHPVTHQFKRHEGVDLRAPINSEVMAVADGEIAATGYGPVTGFYVTVNHADGWSSRYLHLNKINVQTGDKVLRGNVIALSGASGRTNGPHLHLELSHRQQPANPMAMLSVATSTPNLARAQAVAVEEKKIVVEPVDITPVITLISGEGEDMQIGVRMGKKTAFYSPREPVETANGIWRIVKRYGKYRLIKQGAEKEQK